MANPTDFPEEQAGTEVLKLDESQATSLGLKLRNKFTLNESMRKEKELEWLQDLRMINGVYDPDVLEKIGNKRSRAYPKLVRSKKIAVEAKMHDICFPDVGKPWGLSPSPDSTIPDSAMKTIYDNLVLAETLKWQQEREQAMQQGADMSTFPPEPPMPSDQKIQEAIKEYAKATCKKMETEIEDQLVDTKYKNKMKRIQDSGLTLGTGIIKGPLVKFKEIKRWVLDKTARGYVLDKRSVPIPHLEFIRVWDWYPDMTVSEKDQAEGFFERHAMTKHEVRSLARRDDFAPWADKINEYLRNNPDGDCEFKHWEIALQQIDSKGEGEQKKGRRYEVLEYWGYVDARDLEECGVIISEDMKDIELQVNVWLLGKEPIKVILNELPTGEDPYHVFYFEKDDTSIFGKGLPRVMRDTQVNLAAATRMIFDNGAICSGPQVEINTDLIDPDSDYESIFQFKIWPRDGKGVEANAPALRFYNINSHIEEYLKIIDLCLKLADLETAFPTFQLIEPSGVGNETAQGASIRYSTVNIMIKELTKAWDDFNEGILTGMYAWNMDLNEKEEIKGDYVVQVKGLSSLVAKEVRATTLQNLGTTIIPMYKDWIKDLELLQEIWKAADLPLDIIRTEDEHRLYIEETNDPRLLQMQLDKLASEIKEIQAKALGYLARAKKANVDAAEVASGRS